MQTSSFRRWTVIFEEGVVGSTGAIAWKGVEMDIVDASEDAFLDGGVCLVDVLDELFDFLSFGAVLAFLVFASDGACAVQEGKMVGVAPGDDVLFSDAVERANQFHAREIRAVQFGDHPLQLRAVEHGENRRLDDIIEMMAKRNLVASECLGVFVEMSPPHFRAGVAGGTQSLLRDTREDVRLERHKRNLQKLGVFQKAFAVLRRIARIHRQKRKLKRGVGMPLKNLHHLREKHGVLATRDADRDVVTRGNQLVFPNGRQKRGPEFLAEIPRDGLFLELHCHAGGRT